MSSLSLVIGKFELVLCGFLVVYVAGIAPTQNCKLGQKNVVTARRDMKYGSRDPRLVQI